MPLAREAERLAGASRNLQRERELAFCGAEDLTPSDFYRRPDARPPGRRHGWSSAW